MYCILTTTAVGLLLFSRVYSLRSLSSVLRNYQADPSSQVAYPDQRLWGNSYSTMKSTKVQILGAVALHATIACTDEASTVSLCPLNWVIV